MDRLVTYFQLQWLERHLKTRKLKMQYRLYPPEAEGHWRTS
jgi:hypothetical protein